MADPTRVLPRHVKKLRGTYRKDRDNPDAPELPLLLDPGETPEILSERGAAMYDKITTELIEQKMIADIDLNLVLMLCLEYDKYFECIKGESEEGIINHNERSKASQPTGWAKERTRVIRNILDISKALYITPGLRSKLKITQDTIDDDPLGSLIN